MEARTAGAVDQGDRQGVPVRQPCVRPVLDAAVTVQVGMAAILLGAGIAALGSG